MAHSNAPSAHHVAALLIDATTMTIVWCNDTYAEHMAESTPEALIGMSYQDAVPVMSPLKLPVFARVSDTGVPEQGTDYNLNLQDRSEPRHWQAHRPLPGFVLAIIEWGC